MGDVAKRAMEWLGSGETGISSKAICAYMLGGASADDDSYPRDPSDLGRCLRLLDQVPEWKPRMAEMAQWGPVWKLMSERWEVLTASMLEEVGANWERGCAAPKTYAMMREICDTDSRYVRFGPNAQIRTGGFAKVPTE